MSGHAPDRERAEIYLRLQVEAELRTALGYPRYREPSPGLLRRPPRFPFPSPGRRRRRAVMLRAMAHGWSGHPPGRMGRPVAGPGGRLAASPAGRLGRLAGAAVLRCWHVLTTGTDRIGWSLRRWRRRVRHWANLRRAQRPAGLRNTDEWPGQRAHEAADRISALAAALADTGVIAEETAASVLADVETALAARGLIEPYSLLQDAHVGFVPAAGANPPSGPLRALPVGIRVDGESDGQPMRFYLGSMVLAPGHATLSVTCRFPPELAHDHRGPMRELLDCSATDDRGASYEGHFSGGGSPGEWDGQFHLDPVPPASARWLDVTVAGAGPVRVHLDALPETRPTSAVRLPPDEAPDRFVDALTIMLLRAGQEGQLSNLENDEPRAVAVPAALLGAGVLTADSPALRRLAAAATRLGMELPPQLRDVRPGELPTEWLDMLARSGRADGPAGTIPAAAALPEIDGVSLVISLLSSNRESATFRVHARGWHDPVRARRRWNMSAPFRWTARDDLGHCYETDDSGGGFGGGVADLELSLWPAIDPRASTLELVVTGMTTAVSVTVPLDWQEGL